MHSHPYIGANGGTHPDKQRRPRPSVSAGQGPFSAWYPRPDSNRRYRLEGAACPAHPCRSQATWTPRSLAFATHEARLEPDTAQGAYPAADANHHGFRQPHRLRDWPSREEPVHGSAQSSRLLGERPGRGADGFTQLHRLPRKGTSHPPRRLLRASHHGAGPGGQNRQELPAAGPTPRVAACIDASNPPEAAGVRPGRLRPDHRSERQPILSVRGPRLAPHFARFRQDGLPLSRRTAGAFGSSSERPCRPETRRRASG